MLSTEGTESVDFEMQPKRCACSMHSCLNPAMRYQEAQGCMFELSLSLRNSSD